MAGAAKLNLKNLKTQQWLDDLMEDLNLSAILAEVLPELINLSSTVNWVKVSLKESF